MVMAIIIGTIKRKSKNGHQKVKDFKCLRLDLLVMTLTDRLALVHRLIWFGCFHFGLEIFIISEKKMASAFLPFLFCIKNNLLTINSIRMEFLFRA